MMKRMIKRMIKRMLKRMMKVEVEGFMLTGDKPTLVTFDIAGRSSPSISLIV
jgi:hypothetical protein